VQRGVPQGKEKRLPSDEAVEGMANATEQLFQERVEWWGGTQ
jgi:hypothetical protein